MTPVTVAAGDNVAAGSGATGWSARALFEVSGDLYAVTQDSALHVWKSTDDGATWSEQDSADAPSVANSAYSWSAVLNYDASEIQVAYFSATNTIRLRAFTISTDQWAAADIGSSDAATDVHNISPMRVSATAARTRIHHTKASDPCDLSHAIFSPPSSWFVSSDFPTTWAERSIYADVVEDVSFHQRFRYESPNDDFSVRSLTNNANTNGSSVDIDVTVATTEAGHAPATFATYQVSGVTRVTAAYIDADNTINERTASLDVTSASITFGTQRQVTTSTAYAGGKISTCVYDGDRYCFASKADGTSIDYWISTDDTTSNTWGSVNNVTTGSGLHLAQALPVAGVGILLIYQSGSDVVVDWAVDGPGGGAVNDAGTVSVGTVASSGEAITATYGVSATGAVSPGTVAATGESVSAAFTVSATGTVSVGTIAATGQSVSTSASTSVSATITEGAVTASGETITATFTQSALGAITEGVATATGESVTGTFTVSAAATITEGTIVASGETVTSLAGGAAVGIVSPGTATASGETITATAGVSVSATVNQGTAASSGQTVTASAGESVTGTITEGTVTASGESITASFTESADATITQGTATATGQSVTGTFTVAVSASVSPGTIVASGESLAATASGSVVAVVQEGSATASGVMVVAAFNTGASGTVNAGTIEATGYLITTGAGASVTIEPGTIAATGVTIREGPTVYAQPLTATLSSQRVLTASLTSERVLTTTITSRRVLGASVASERVLTAELETR